MRITKKEALETIHYLGSQYCKMNPHTKQDVLQVMKYLSKKYNLFLEITEDRIYIEDDYYLKSPD